MRSALLLTLVMLTACLPGGALASTLIYPHALFMDDQSRSTVLYVQNSGEWPTEIEILLRFGYPASDSLGGVHMELIETPGPGAPSAADWVRALPRRLLVQPGERQAVRLLARPPAELPAGEYWSRVIVTSRDGRPLQTGGADGKIRVGLTLETRTIISLSYRRAQVFTGVKLKGFRAAIEDGKVTTQIELQRLGNAAFLGRLALDLVDERGAEVAHWDRVIAVYYDLFRRLDFPVQSLAPGRYVLHMNLSTTRQDIPETYVLKAETVGAVVELTVP